MDPIVTGDFKKMMWTETYRLPMPLSVNDYYEPRYNSKTRHCYIQKSYKAKKYCGLVCVEVYRNVKRRQFQHEVAVKIEWHFKQSLLTQPQKWRDCDNGVKCLLDALTEAKVWVDDKIVYRFSGIERFFDSESENYCVVRITGE